MPFHLYRSFYKNNLGMIFYQKRSLATLVWFLSDIYTHDTCRLLYHNNIMERLFLGNVGDEVAKNGRRES